MRYADLNPEERRDFDSLGARLESLLGEWARIKADTNHKFDINDLYGKAEDVSAILYNIDRGVYRRAEKK